LGVDELFEPLIALGIAENAQQVHKMFVSVDEDGSG
jgi:Ca2+-binding EF-hand superfamily protein